MSLTSRLSVHGPATEDPEDYFAASLGVIFPDDVTNQHGDAAHMLVYTSPNLPQPIHISLCDPLEEADRKLFSHFLWNASLQLAQLIEEATLGLGPSASPKHMNVGTGAETAAPAASVPSRGCTPPWGTDVAEARRLLGVRGHAVLELGAGSALPSLVSAQLGAARVAITDYPSPPVLKNLRDNLRRWEAAAQSQDRIGEQEKHGKTVDAMVIGHAWGSIGDNSNGESGEIGAEANSKAAKLDSDEPDPLAFAVRERGQFTRVFACDCLWMPWQHDALRRSIGHFLAPSPSKTSFSSCSCSLPAAAVAAHVKSANTGSSCKNHKEVDAAHTACAWVVAGFHTGRANVAKFFDASALRRDGCLEIERIWERDCDGVDRPWEADRGVEDVSERKRWLVIAVLRRLADEEGEEPYRRGVDDLPSLCPQS